MSSLRQATSSPPAWLWKGCWHSFILKVPRVTKYHLVSSVCCILVACSATLQRWRWRQHIFLYVGKRMLRYMAWHIHSTAEGVDHRLPICAARIRSEIRSCESCVNKMPLGAGFLQLIWFPLRILIPPPAARSLIIPWHTDIQSRYWQRW
jgi:hypothetical protein